jgi:hypothetical protein
MVKRCPWKSAVDETGFSLKKVSLTFIFNIGEDGDFQVGDIMKNNKVFYKN